MSEQTQPLNETKPDKPVNLLGLVCLSFLVAFGLRLIKVSSLPFSATEAELAARALEIARGNGAGTGVIPAYLGLTSITFFITSASNFWARFWPVILGSSLTFLPYFWREKLKPVSVIILAFVFALDPLLFLFSHLIVGPIFAAAGLLWFVTCIHQKRPIFAGIWLALAILGGSWFWVGLAATILTFFASALISQPKLRLQAVTYLQPFSQRIFVIKFLASLFITLFFISTSFLLNPGGISGIGQGLADFISSFTVSFIHPIWAPAWILVAYSFLPIILSIAAFVSYLRKTERQENAHLFLLFMCISLVLSIVFSRHDFGNLIFVVLSIWIFSVGWFAEQSFNLPWKNSVYLVMTLFLLVIFVYLGLSLSAFIKIDWGSDQIFRYALAIIGGFLVILLSVLLVSMGWSKSVATKSLVTAGLFILAINTLSLTFNGLSNKTSQSALLLSDSALVFPTSEPNRTISEFERLGKIEADNDRVAVIGSEIAGIDWVFRNFDQQPLLMISDFAADPEIVLSVNENEPKMDSSYRGMKIVVQQDLDWMNLNSADYLKFVFGEDLKTRQTEAIFWIRTDLFTGVNQ